MVAIANSNNHKGIVTEAYVPVTMPMHNMAARRNSGAVSLSLVILLLFRINQLPATGSESTAN